jgi:fibronectin type 3 domain-containing protein
MMKKLALLTLMAMLLMAVAGCGGVSIPSSPTGLTVLGTAPITLSWTGASGASGYSIYRGTISGGLAAKTLLASNVSATTYADTSAVTGNTYYYQVRAVNTNGSSDVSNEVTATAQTQSTTSFVLGGSKDATKITLNWVNVSGAVSYNVYRDTISAAITHKTKVSSGILLTTVTDTSVTPGSTYYYQVTAVNAAGTEFLESNETSIAF